MERVEARMPGSFRREYSLAEGTKPYFRVLFVVFVFAGGASAFAGMMDNAIEFFTMAAAAGVARPLGRFINRHRPHHVDNSPPTQ